MNLDATVLKVIGPCDFRSIRKDKVLDPFLQEPSIDWGNKTRKENI
jgi:hypothetical protein